MIVEQLLWNGVDDSMCFCSVADSSYFGVLARGANGVDDGVSVCGVTQNGLVIHEPNVDKASMGVDGVVWVLCVVLQKVCASIAGGHLKPLGPLVGDGLPCCLSGLLFVRCGRCSGPWEVALCLGLVNKCPSFSSLFNQSR